MYAFGQIYANAGRPFNQTYRCYSSSMMPTGDREDVERGGKIIMPPSALDQLSRLNIQYPMLFKLTNDNPERTTHCGVLEFIAEEGRIYIPYWMMRNLLVDQGGFIMVENVSLQVATFARFEPQTLDFLDISNPKAVLENALRKFACLTIGDVIAIKYNEKDYELRVLETKPGDAVSIIECDMNVDFTPPVGYQEPNVKKDEDMGTGMEEVDAAAQPFPDASFKAFSGSGNRLDGKKKGTESSPSTSGAAPGRRGIPNYNYKKGTITFIRTARPVTNGSQPEEKPFEAFTGEGKTLKSKSRK